MSSFSNDANAIKTENDPHVLGLKRRRSDDDDDDDEDEDVNVGGNRDHNAPQPRESDDPERKQRKSEDLTLPVAKKSPTSSSPSADMLALPTSSSAAPSPSREASANLSEEDKRKLKEQKKLEQEREERERMQVLVSNFTEDQLDRYEMFRRAAFPKAAIKRVIQAITGISKVFVGEVIEEALDYMESLGESGPIKPKHLREATRRMKNRGKLPRTRSKTVL